MGQMSRGGGMTGKGSKGLETYFWLDTCIHSPSQTSFALHLYFLLTKFIP